MKEGMKTEMRIFFREEFRLMKKNIQNEVVSIYMYK